MAVYEPAAQEFKPLFIVHPFALGEKMAARAMVDGMLAVRDKAKELMNHHAQQANKM